MNLQYENRQNENVKYSNKQKIASTVNTQDDWTIITY